MFGIGGTELVLILLFAFLIFGPDKLPGMGRTIGRALRQFRHAQEGFTQVVQSEIVDPATEAMNADAGRPNRRRAEEFDEDADIETPEGEGAPAPRRAETFAERKKRLAAEKLAREAEAAEAAAAAAADQGDADSDADVDAAAPAAESGEAAKPAEKPRPTAADLYSMTRPSRATSAGGDGVSPDATREASEERSDERGAAAGDAAAPSTTPDDDTKEA